MQTLEERLLEAKGQLAHAVSQNEKLTFTLQQAKEQLAALREEVEKLTQPPGRLWHLPGDSTTTGRSTSSLAGARCASPCTPTSTRDGLRKGNEVVLNESLNVVLVREGELAGEVVTLKEILEDRTARHRLRPRRRGAGGRALRGPARRAPPRPGTPC